MKLLQKIKWFFRSLLNYKDESENNKPFVKIEYNPCEGLTQENTASNAGACSF